MNTLARTISACLAIICILLASKLYLRAFLSGRVAQTFSATSENIQTIPIISRASAQANSAPGETKQTTALITGQTAPILSVTGEKTLMSSQKFVENHNVNSSLMDCARLNVKFGSYQTNALKQKKAILSGSLKGASWRSNILKAIQAHPLPSGDVYEFGVFNGGSIVGLHAFFARKTWGFDSFSGLPPESTKIDFQNSGFAAGKYKAKKNIPECMQAFLGGPSEIDFVKGYFSKSLTSTLAHERSMRPAAYVDIDVDLYTATFEALDWLFNSHLMQVGTLVGYDDWWSNSCAKGAPKNLSPLATSEGKAHSEIARKHKVKFSCVAGSCDYQTDQASLHIDWGPIFKIESLGGSTTPDHGFRLTPDQELRWRHTNPVCAAEQLSHTITGR